MGLTSSKSSALHVSYDYLFFSVTFHEIGTLSNHDGDGNEGVEKQEI